MSSQGQMPNMVDMLSPPGMKMESTHSPGHYPMQSQSPSINPQNMNGPGPPQNGPGPMGFPSHMVPGHHPGQVKKFHAPLIRIALDCMH